MVFNITELQNYKFFKFPIIQLIGFSRVYSVWAKGLLNSTMKG